MISINREGGIGDYRVNEFVYLKGVAMTLVEKIEDWKKFPNALGSEAQVAVIIGQVTAKLNEEIPDAVKKALKVLSLRGTMRDLASSAGRSHEEDLADSLPILSIVDAGAASCGISWAESIAVIAGYLEEKKAKLEAKNNEEKSILYQLVVSERKKLESQNGKNPEVEIS